MTRETKIEQSQQLDDLIRTIKAQGSKSHNRNT